MLDTRKTREKLKKCIDDYKNDTGLKQVDIADKLGMSQPALSRYLTGTLALNDNFIAAIAKLTGKSRHDLTVYANDDLAEVVVRHTTSGTRYVPGEKEVLMIKTNKRLYGVEVDTETIGLKLGTIILVDEDERPCENDNVVVYRNGQVFYGVLKYDPQFFASGWFTVLPNKNLLEINADDRVLRAAGFTYPSTLSEARRFNL